MKALVACSGGPDSVALVHALRTYINDPNWSFVVGHVNHQLRGRDSEEDALFVRALGRRVGWPVEIKKCPLTGSKGNLEENARNIRYKALEQMALRHNCQFIFTAHTCDDQAETIFFNLLRGSGPDGLGGMWPLRFRNSGTILLGRPFLDVTKSQVMDYLKNNGLKFRWDRSNENTKFVRNWMRRGMFPDIEKRFPGFQRRLARLGVVMRDEHQDWVERWSSMKRKLIKPSRWGACLDFRGLLSYSAAVQRRFLRAELGGDLLTFDAVENLRRWMGGPPSGGRLWQLKHGWIVERLSRSKGAPSASIFVFRKSRKKNLKHPIKRRV